MQYPGLNFLLIVTIFSEVISSLLFAEYPEFVKKTKQEKLPKIFLIIETINFFIAAAIGTASWTIGLVIHHQISYSKIILNIVYIAIIGAILSSFLTFKLPFKRKEK